ncbi:tyrosine-type recombinase/integrase [Bacillus sp. DJP31]|uniref:tyrosine-type recombinase/integrase n=1 Tax=Bacillus sp. DJP31 TaxID=3409789 RepID=UPI003BB51648
MYQNALNDLKDHGYSDSTIEGINRTGRMSHQAIRDEYYNKDFIFGKMERQFGYPIVIKTVRNRMKRILTISGLNTELTPHSLRHTHMSLLAEARVSLGQIMDRLDYIDDQITKNVYLHVPQEMKKKPLKSSLNS